ncbi:hypothetical protein C0991_002210 [Blastosporella zonata]|nr:hypothetical protein C0991_002210 [Blastosporella zonata]
MAGAYAGLPHIEYVHALLGIVPLVTFFRHRLVLEPTGYDALIDRGSARYASVSIMAPLMRADELKLLRDALFFKRTGFYVNFARMDPLDFLCTKYNRVTLKGKGAFCFGIMSGVVTHSYLFNESVTISGKKGSFRQHRLMVVPFRQEAYRDISAIGAILNLGDGTKGAVSSDGFAFVTRGEGQSIQHENSNGYAVPVAPPTRNYVEDDLFTVTQDRKPRQVSFNDPYKAVIDFEDRVPVYNGRPSTGRPFTFSKDDFDALPSWRRPYKGNEAELPNKSVVSVGYSPNSFKGNVGVFLTLNIAFVIVLHTPEYAVGIGPSNAKFTGASSSSSKPASKARGSDKASRRSGGL